MLKTKHQPNTVVTAKLVSGEEVIGYFVEDNDNELTLRKPVVPVPMEQGIGLAPFVMSSNYLHDANDNISFNKVTVISVMKTSDQFRDVYMKQTSGFDFSAGQNTNPGLITT